MTSSWLLTTNYYALTSRSRAAGRRVETAELIVEDVAWAGRARKPRRNDHDLVGVRIDWKESELRDRKSTRLNSSHANISYAVFCLKKKKKKKNKPQKKKKQQNKNK